MKNPIDKNKFVNLEVSVTFKFNTIKSKNYEINHHNSYKFIYLK